MAWNQSSAYTPSNGARAAVAAGAALAGGWLDVAGNVWSLDAQSRFAAAIQSNPWNTALLARPSGEAALNQRIRVLFTYAAPGDGLYPLLRSAPGASAAGYVVGLNGATPYLGKVTGGALAQIVTGSGLGLVVGNDYWLEGSVVQASGTTTALSVQVFAADGTTALAAATTANDTAAALQNVTGVAGLFQFIPAGGSPTPVKGLWTYTDGTAAAASLSLTGSVSGGSGLASAPFTVAANGTLAAARIVSPSDGGAGGTFTPASLTLTAAAPSATFTYTPASPGAKALAIANDGGLTNPEGMTYAAVNLVPVNNPAWRFSPGNWRGDAGRGGSSYRQTWNVGAYAVATWLGSASPSATLLLPASATGCVVSYILNGKLSDGVAATAGIALGGLLPNAANTLRVMLRNSPQSARWNGGANTLRVLGLQLDNASSAGTAAAVSGWDLIVGDSLTEGIAASAGADSHLACWSYHLGQAIRDAGREYCIDACGFSGWLRPGDTSGDVPAYYATPGGTYADAASRWNKVDAGISRLDANGQLSAYGAVNTPPSNIWIMLGTNEAISASSVSDTTAAVRQGLAALRAAAPLARIRVVVPFGIYATGVIAGGPTYAAAVKAGVSAYQAARPTDAAVEVIDFGADFSALLTSTLYGGAVVHWGAAGHALAAAKVAARLTGAGVAAPQFRRTLRG